MTLEQPLVANPVERLPARAPVQPRVPEPSNKPIEPLETAIVRRSPVVLVVAPEFGVERRGLMNDRVVPMVLAPLRHRLHTASKAFAHGPDVNRKPPPSAARTHMRETEKVEGRRLRRVGTARKRRAAERQQPRLLRVERQTIPRESLGKHFQDPLRVLAVLKAENEVIGVPNFGSHAAQARLHLVLEPLVEHLLQVNVGQQGTDDLPLSGPGLGYQEPAVFDTANVNPFPNHPEDAAVANPSLDERHELAPHNPVEVALNVGFEDIGGCAVKNRAANRIERVVRTPTRAEAVGACEEVLLVNRVEHRDRGLLYDLVLESRNRDRALVSVLLRDVDPTQRLHAVLVTHEAMVERRDVPPHVLFLFPVRDR